MTGFVRRFGTLAALVLIIVAFSIVSPGAFGSPSNLINITQQMTLLAIVAIGAIRHPDRIYDHQL